MILQKKKNIFRQKSVEASCCLRPSVTFAKSKLKSREKSCHKAAALSAIRRHRCPLLQICTFGCVLLIPLPYFPPSGAVLQFFADQMFVMWSIQRLCCCISGAYVCVNLLMVAAWARSGLQSTQLRFSFLWGAGLYWRGLGTNKSGSTCPPGWRIGCRAANAA